MSSVRNFFRMSNVIKIDGSLGEGGGQVLRVSLSLSTLFGIPIVIDNIRAGRPKPGLAAQHVKGLELVTKICNAKTTGARIGSTRVEFNPGPMQRQTLEFIADTGTAGCICLLAQVALPCILFAPASTPITLILKGGTNVPMGPQIEYLSEVFKPILNTFGADFDFTVLRRGYYPRGGGEFHMRIPPIRSLNAINMLDPGEPVNINGWSFVAWNINIQEADKMRYDATRKIHQSLSQRDIIVPPMDILSYKEATNMAVADGYGINLVCKTSTDCIYGGSGLGTMRDPNSPGIDAANGILTPILSKACVDQQAQDQIIIFMALAKGRSRVQIGEQEMTSHTETAIKVAEIMLADRGVKFNVTRRDNEGNSGPYILECEGCGLVNNFLK